MEATNQELLNRIESFKHSFNWKEITIELKQNLDKVFDEATPDKNENELYSILNWLRQRYTEYKIANCRYIFFSGVNERKKYTPFYNLVRTAYEEANPSLAYNLKTNPWQIIDMAIIQLESGLKNGLRDETDLMWAEKLTEKYFNEETWLQYVDEFVELMGIVDGVDDYFVLDIVERYYLNGDYPNGRHEKSEEQLYISRESNQAIRVSYEDAYEKLSNNLVSKIVSIMNDMKKILATKYDEKKLFKSLQIEEGYESAFRLWYQDLVNE